MIIIGHIHFAYFSYALSRIAHCHRKSCYLHHLHIVIRISHCNRMFKWYFDDFTKLL